MPIDQPIKDRAYAIDPECWRSYSGKSKAYKRAMETRRIASLDRAQREYGVADPLGINEEVERRAREIDPCAFKSYSGHERVEAQEAARVKARQELFAGPRELQHCAPEGRIQCKYSLDEIDRMRKAIDRNPACRLRPSFGRYTPQDFWQHTEQQLRTHMLNGTEPSDLEAEADAEWERIRERHAERERARQEVASNELPFKAAEMVAMDLPLSLEKRKALREHIERAIRAVVSRWL